MSELIDLTKKVEVVLDLRKISDVKAQVCLAIDYSWSMKTLYQNGTVEKTIGRISAVAVKFDDNGELDVLVFEDGVREASPATPRNFGSYVSNNILNQGWRMGGTNYSPFIQKAVENYFDRNIASAVVDNAKGILGALKNAFGFGKKEIVPAASTGAKSKSGFPVLVIIVTDGENFDKSETTALLTQMQDKDIYWQFVGIGYERFSYLQKIANDLPNVGFFSIPNIETVKDMELYKNLLSEEFAAWVKKF